MGILRKSGKKITNALQNNTVFWTALVLEILLFSWLNFENETMSGIVRYYQDFAAFFQSGFSLSMPFKTGSETFPMWGYGFIFLVTQNKLLIVVFQQLLSLYTIYFVDKSLREIKAFSDNTYLIFRIFALLGISWHILHTSLWPYSVSACSFTLSIFFVLRYFYFKTPKYIYYSGILLGITLNFRSDYVYFAFAFAFLLGIIWWFSKQITPKMIALWLALVFLLLMPWGIYTHYKTGHFLLSSTNAGHVLFISLGQLPNNIWHITPLDEDSTMRSTVHPISSLSYNGDVVLKAAWKAKIKEQPKEFVKKCAYNACLYFLRPFSTGEIYRKFINDTAEIDALNGKLKKDIQGLSIKNILADFVDKRFMGFLIPILINLLGMAINGVFWGLVLYQLVKSRLKILSNPYFLVLLSVALYQFALLIFAYYHPNYNTNIFLMYVAMLAILLGKTDKELIRQYVATPSV